MKLFSTLLVCCIALNFSFGQHYHRGCGTYHLDSLRQASNPDYKKSRDNFEKSIQRVKKSRHLNRSSNSPASELIYTIPVVFHVVYSSPISNIPETEILEQLDALNADFRRTNSDASSTPSIYANIAADVKIQFCMATKDPDGNPIDIAVTRTPSTQNEYNYITDDDNLKSIISWPSEQYLNVWITKLEGDILGYAQFPTNTNLDGLGGENGQAYTDGVVVDYRAFGIEQPYTSPSSPYRLGRTLTHEVGHWLGLFHIFGNTDAGCLTDFVDDTPRQRSNDGFGSCDSVFFNCDPQPVMFQNYMDYSNDACMNLFTLGQKERMRTALTVGDRRQLLLSSTGCCGGNSDLVTVPYTEPFEDDFASINWNDTLYKNNFPWNMVTTFYDQSIELNTDTNSTASIISPFIDFSDSDAPSIKFDMAYNGATSNDVINIYYELTCSDSWIPIASYNSSNYPNTISSFNEEAWNPISLSIPELANQKIVRFRIEGIASNGNKWYFDNFNAFKTSPELNSFIFPNPSNGDAFFETIFDGEHEVSIYIFNTLGQLVSNTNYNKTNSAIFQLPLDNLSSGLYIVKVKVNGQESVSRLSLLR